MQDFYHEPHEPTRTITFFPKISRKDREDRKGAKIRTMTSAFFAPLRDDFFMICLIGDNNV